MSKSDEHKWVQAVNGGRPSANGGDDGDDDRSTPPHRGPGRGPGDGPGTGTLTRTRPKTKKPSMYKVLLLNDDYTPMEFVVLILQRYFHLSIEDATRVMLQVHHKGVGVCGVFTYEIAETKATAVLDYAKKHQHPLQCRLEKE